MPLRFQQRQPPPRFPDELLHLSREDILKRIYELLTAQLAVDSVELSENVSFQEDLKANSLDLVELIMEIEDQFDVKISDEDASRMQTPGQVADWFVAQQQLALAAGDTHAKRR